MLAAGALKFTSMTLCAARIEAYIPAGVSVERITRMGSALGAPGRDLNS